MALALPKALELKPLQDANASTLGSNAQCSLMFINFINVCKHTCACTARASLDIIHYIGLLSCLRQLPAAARQTETVMRSAKCRAFHGLIKLLRKKPVQARKMLMQTQTSDNVEVMTRMAGSTLQRSNVVLPHWGLGKI